MAAYYGGWKPYVSVASRRAKAMKEMQKRRKQGQNVSPIVIEGRNIVKTVWGEAWCDTWNGTATMRTGCRGADPMCATDRWWICR